MMSGPLESAGIRPVCPIPARCARGQLELLPPELLLLILDQLDFQSLSRLSRACFRGKTVVESLPAYEEMIEHAPDTLAALGKTHLLRYHSASLVRQALRSGKCVSCFDFGAFLFLPTCERVCFECLYENYGLRVIPLSAARKCFHLTDKQLRRISIMRSIPGTYSVLFYHTRRRVRRLVSVREAKRLAIQIHGSAENVAKFAPEIIPRRFTTRPQFRESLLFKRYHAVPLEPPGCDMSRLPEGGGSGVEDCWGGVASIRFPWLTETGAEGGRVCRGCEVTYKLYRRSMLPATVLSRLVSPVSDSRRPIWAMVNRLRSSQEFLNHVKGCYGARHLLLGQDDL